MPNVVSPVQAQALTPTPPTEPPTVTETATAEPSATASPTELGSTATATPDPTATLVSEATPEPALSDAGLQVEAIASPAQAKPGDKVTIKVILTNVSAAAYTNLTYTNKLPAAFNTNKKDAGDLQFDPATQQLMGTVAGHCHLVSHCGLA